MNAIHKRNQCINLIQRQLRINSVYTYMRFFVPIQDLNVYHHESEHTKRITSRILPGSKKKNIENIENCTYNTL